MLKRIMRPVVGVARQNGVTSHAPNVKPRFTSNRAYFTDSAFEKIDYFGFVPPKCYTP
jgi:hypothetical protein